MYLYGGIVALVLGISIFILGVTKVLPNAASAGFALIMFGLLLIGFSFIPRPETDETEPMPVWERLAKIFFAPTEVFQNFRHHPAWMVAVLLAAIMSGVYSTAFVYRITPEVITNYTADKLGESGFVQPEKVAQLKKQNLEIAKSPIAKAGSFINGFVALSFIVAFFGALYLLIILAMGGEMNYWQAVSVAAYALFPVIMIQRSLSLLILFFKDTTQIHPILGQQNLLMDNLSFLITPAQSPVLYTLLTSLSLTGIYGLWLAATGLKNAGYKVSGTTGWVAAVIVWLLLLTFGIVIATLFGSMFS